MLSFGFEPEPETSGDGFEEFWAGYPKKVAKKAARKAWARLKPSMDLQQMINDSVDEHAKSKQWRDGFIPHAATFINGERWTDELDPRRDFLRAKL